MNKIDKYLIINIAFMMVFTVVDIVLTCKGFYISQTLENCAFTYFLGECGITGLIKVSATIQEAINNRQYQLEDALRTRRETIEDRAYYDKKEIP